MMTPRRQAIVATLSGVASGIACLGVVVAVRDDPPAEAAPSSLSTTATTPPSPDPSRPLDPAAIRYESQRFDSGKDGEITLQVPTGWTFQKQDGRRARFDHPSEAWLLRIDAAPSHRSVDEMLTDRLRSLRRTQDLTVIRRDHGTRQPDQQHRTLVYSYRNENRGTRLVLSRWISAGSDDRAAIEVTVAGRPEDLAGLESVLARATDTLVLP